MRESVKKYHFHFSFRDKDGSKHILFYAKNMKQYTEYFYVKPMYDLLGFR